MSTTPAPINIEEFLESCLVKKNAFYNLIPNECIKIILPEIRQCTFLPVILP